MRYDSKIALAVREDLAAWQKLNVTAFLAGGLVGQHRELAGEPYANAGGQPYSCLVRQPILIFAADGPSLAKCLERALARNLRPAIYTAELFATGNDADNRAAVAAVATGDLDLVGLGLYGERKEIDKVTKGVALHR